MFPVRIRCPSRATWRSRNHHDRSDRTRSPLGAITGVGMGRPWPSGERASSAHRREGGTGAQGGPSCASVLGSPG